MNNTIKVTLKDTSEPRVFLGGTYGKPGWRNSLKTLLNEDIDCFDPTDEYANLSVDKETLSREKEIDRVITYVVMNNVNLLPVMIDLVDFSNKYPEKVIFCNLLEKTEANSSDFDAVMEIKSLVENNGVKTVTSLTDLAEEINQRFST